ncbi:MAG TPA: cytosine permease [Candidatus Acidoferrales bacterium]|nr:cytosine permease [Candidatus Acidoferrales bacterium]
MASVTVPTREGQYGERVVAVEPGGVEFIPLSERHGRPLDLFWTWMSPNLEFATVFVGTIGIVLFGGSLWSVVGGIVVGTALGSITHGVLSSWGPRLGVPQMVQSRAAFGYRGNVLPAALNTFTAGIGWFIVNSVSGAFALMALFDMGASLFPVAFLIIVAAQVAVAFFGHNLVHAFERAAFVPLVIIFAIATGFILANAHAVAFNAAAPVAFGGDLGAFILTAAAAFGYAPGWNPYASDYTRYQRPGADLRAVGLWAGLGVFVSCVALEVAGAGLATVAGTKWGPNDIPTAQLAQAMPDLVYKATLLAIALGAVAANVLNIYSAAMSFLTLGVRLTLRQRRAIVAAASGLLGLVIGIAFEANVGPGSKYEEFLLVISYWIGPWLGVIFADHWLRRGDYGDGSIFFDARRDGWQGPVAMLVAGAVAIYFFAAQALYTGPVPLRWPQLGDLTFLVGFALAWILTVAFRRGARGTR